MFELCLATVFVSLIKIDIVILPVSHIFAFRTLLNATHNKICLDKIVDDSNVHCLNRD